MTWPAPEPQPCPVIRAWIGPCGETDRTKCKHFTYDRDWPRCSCGRPAIAECENAGSFVCGMPICHPGFCTGHGGSCSNRSTPNTLGQNPSYKRRPPVGTSRKTP